MNIWPSAFGSSRCTRFACLLSALVGLVLVSGCAGTFKEIKPLSSRQPPAERPKEIAVGDIRITDARLSAPEQVTMAYAFRLGVEKWCVAKKGLTYVGETNSTVGRIVLSGIIQEVEKGSAAARFWVGMGAGQARVQGEFTLFGQDGSELTRFSARKSYLGGVGAGGWDMLELKELVSRLGEVAAETTDKWLRGEKLK